MLKLILALLPLATYVTGQQQAPKSAKVSGQPAASAPSGIQGIPAGAVKIDENTYRYQEKDSSGKPGKSAPPAFQQREERTGRTQRALPDNVRATHRLVPRGNRRLPGSVCE